MVEYEIDINTGERRVKANGSTTSDKTPALTDEQLQDKGYLRDLAINELAAIVKANGGKAIGTNACNALLDRVEGKAVQVINQHVTVVEEMNDLELAKAILFYTRPALLNKEQPILDVTPMPGKIGD